MLNFIESLENKGVKKSELKLSMSKIFVQFPDALKAVMLASTFGHVKYEEFDKDWLNYKRVEGQDYSDAMVRHQLLKDESEEESGLHPKIHVAWNAIADLQKHLENNDVNIDNLAEKKIKEWRNEYSK